MGFEAGGGLDDVLDAAEVVDTGQLDEDLIAAELIGLDDGLADAEGVGAALDDLDGLVKSALLGVSSRRWVSW